MSGSLVAPILSSDVDAWGREVDLVVIGLGVAGACAALEAVERGLEVLIIERSSGGGGASATSEGIFYLGGGTALQEACGYEDTPEQMYAFLRASTSCPDDERLRVFCEGASRHFDWLERHGVPFERRAFTGKAVAVRTGEGLLTTGNEKVWPFRDEALPVPRGHQARASLEVGGGASAMQGLLAAVSADEVPVLFDTAVNGLVVGADGAICGVQISSGGVAIDPVRARRGVVVASGSFNLNAEMTSRFIPAVARQGRPLGVDTNDGFGIALGRSVGARTAAMDGVIATASIYPPESLVFGIIVNANGERFVSEDSYHGRTAYFVERQPDQRAYLLVDEEHFAYPERGHPLVDVWESVADAEQGLGLPTGSLDATLAAYNEAAGRGDDPQFHKHAAWLAPLRGPLAAFDLSYAAGKYSYITLGGLETDADARVLHDNKDPIEGLYAAGAVAAHLPQNGAEYASGLSLGPGSFFARRAVAHAAAKAAS